MTVAPTSCTSTLGTGPNSPCVPCGTPVWGENGAGCPLTPNACDRWRSANSRALGAAPWAHQCRLEHADQIPLVPVAPAGNRAVDPSARRRPGAGGDQRQRGAHRAGRGVGYRQGGAGVLCAGAQCAGVGSAAAGGADLPDDDPLAAGDGGSAGGAGRDPGGDGGHQRLLEGALLPAGGARVRGVAGQRQGCQAPAGAAQDRPAGRGVAGQGRRAAAAAAQLRAATGDPSAAGCGPLPG
jgi:hypothetical protein